MGGSIAITLRHNSTEYRMERWTNIMPTALHQPDFIDGKPEAIADFLSSWLNMKEDWETNGPKGPFKYPMTECYSPYPYGLKPSEYGAVVIDFDTKTLLSLQGYCLIGGFDWSEPEYGDTMRRINPEKFDLIETLFAQNRISHYRLLTNNQNLQTLLLSLPGATLHQSQPQWLTIPTTVSRRDLLDLLAGQKKSLRNAFCHWELVMNMAPFTVIEFSEDAAGYTAMLAKIDAMGFDLSVKERKAWEKKIAYFDTDEEDEDEDV